MTNPPQGIRIAVDAMGGDYAPDVNIKGAIGALEASPNLHILLTGPEDTIRKGLKKHKAMTSASISDRLGILHADEVISMDDHAGSVMRKKKGSSIHVGLQAVKDGKADAFISAGNSGAVMTVALLILGRIPGVERPAIVIKFPTAGDYIVLLDGGANVDCKPSHLFQFAVMGRIYAQVIEGKKHPRIGLLSNGSEEHKGNDLTRETHALLKEAKVPDYIGYVEGFDFFRGTSDVIVCDGFVGNVSLKLAEGLADTAFQWFRKEIRQDVRSLLGLLLMKNVLKKFKSKFDYEPYGAAPLMGIDGMVLISHGSSSDIAIQNGILTASRGVEQQLVEKTRGYISNHLMETKAAETEMATS
jgi:phosphate acyltransferase